MLREMLRFRAGVLFLISYLVSAVVGQVTLSSDAQGNSIEVGSSITYTCMLDQRYSQNDVIWMRKTGSISLDLTSNDGHLVPSLASGRYSSASSTDSDGNKLHQLIIRRTELSRFNLVNIMAADALAPYVARTSAAMNIDCVEYAGPGLTGERILETRYEDGGQVGCRLSSSLADPQFLTMIVCDDTSKDWCQCAIDKGWPDPDCFERPQSVKDMEKSFKATVTGLGVCFAITIIYAIIVSLCLSTDCAKKLNARRKRADAIRQAKADHRHNPYLDSEVVQIDPNDVSQISSEEALRTKVAPVNPYNPAPSKHGSHDNRAFSNEMYDDNEPNYQEIGATAAAPHAQPNGSVPRGASGGYHPNMDLRMPEAPPRGDHTPNRMAPERSRSKLDQPDGYNASPRTPNGYPPRSPGYPQYPEGGGYNRMESYDSNLSASTKPRTPGYDSYDGKSPGAWSTQSAKMPYASQDPPYNNAAYPNDTRGAYSERPNRDNRYQRSHQSEPRRLDFVDNKASAAPYNKDSSMYNGYSENLNGPYIDSSSTGV